MLVTLFNTSPGGPSIYTKCLGNFEDWTWVMLQVKGAGKVTFGSTEQELREPATGAGGITAGFTIDATAVPPVQALWWKGQLWATADTNPTFINIETFTRPLIPA